LEILNFDDFVKIQNSDAKEKFQDQDVKIRATFYSMKND